MSGAFEQISVDGWIDRLEERGRLRRGAPVAELDPDCLRAHAAGLRGHLGAGALADPVWAPRAGIGAARDPLDGRATYGFPLVGAISHPVIPYTLGELLEAAPDLLAALRAADGPGARFASDTFVPVGDGAGLEPRAVWLRSPVADLRGGTEAWWGALGGKRRQRLSAGLRAAEAPGVELELSPRPPDGAELRWARDQLEDRWSGDHPYAFAQVLWPAAVAATRPELCLFLRVRVDGAPAVLNGYLRRGPELISQTTCRDPARCPDGLGTALDAWLLRGPAASLGLTRLDPTCRTGLDDPPSISVSKRAVVNADRLRPLLLLGEPPPEHAGLPHLEPSGAWRAPPVALPLGDPP